MPGLRSMSKEAELQLSIVHLEKFTRLHVAFQ